MKKFIFFITIAITQIFATSIPSARAAEEKERSFYEVLHDLLSDFEFDLKENRVSGLRDLSIRNIVVSENVPASFKSHLELVVTEKILGATKTRMVKCLQCRSKRAILGRDQVRVSTPENNPIELARIAKMNGIQNFMDIAFSYQADSMVMSLGIADSETGSLVWSHSYDSETSKASAARRGVDPESLEKSMRENEYFPTKQFRLLTYYLNEPDAGDRSSCLGIGGRFVERYDRKHKEVGIELDVIFNTSLVSGSSKTTTATDNGSRIFSGFNLTPLFVHSWNFFGEEENFNQMRGTATIGIGGTYAPSFLGALIRGSYEWRLAKHWAVHLAVGFRPKATTTISGPEREIKGLEYGVGISAVF